LADSSTLDVEWKETYFTIGKQQVVWSKADGLKVLGVVNPQSFREFIMTESLLVRNWCVKKLDHADIEISQLGYDSFN
jgi:hypothetical protein